MLGHIGSDFRPDTPIRSSWRHAELRTGRVLGVRGPRSTTGAGQPSALRRLRAPARPIHARRRWLTLDRWSAARPAVGLAARRLGEARRSSGLGVQVGRGIAAGPSTGSGNLGPGTEARLEGGPSTGSRSGGAQEPRGPDPRAALRQAQGTGQRVVDGTRVLVRQRTARADTVRSAVTSDPGCMPAPGVDGSGGSPEPA